MRHSGPKTWRFGPSLKTVKKFVFRPDLYQGYAYRQAIVVVCKQDGTLPSTLDQGKTHKFPFNLDPLNSQEIAVSLHSLIWDFFGILKQLQI